MERVQRDIVAVAIPECNRCSAQGLFGRDYTTYDVVYTLSNPTELCTVAKRYREFRELKRTLSDDSLPLFPEKRIFESRRNSIVEERRQGLQVWLQAVIDRPHHRKPLRDFLGAQDSVSSSVPLITEEEQSVLDFISNVEVNSRMKLSWLANLDSALFAKTPRIRLEYMRKLVDLLTMLCADHMAGCKAICILQRLTTRECYREHENVVKVWLALGPDRLSAMGLDLHLLHQMYADTREEAFNMFKIIYDAWSSLGRGLMLRIVRVTQLNGNLEAYSLFERWMEDRLDENREVAKETSWLLLPPASADLCIYFRFIENYIELKVGMRIQASCDRVASCLRDPQERAIWDSSYLRQETVTQSEGTMDFSSEVHGHSVGVRTEFKVMRQWPNRICIDFRSREDPTVTQNPSILSRYIIIPGDHQLPSTPRASERPQFPALEEPSPASAGELKAESHEATSTVKHYLLICKALGRAYIPDLLGESDRLRNTYLSLKKHAEMVTRSPAVSLSDDLLSRAVDRKTLTPTTKRRVSKRINLQTMTVDDQVVDSRLARRMF